MALSIREMFLIVRAQDQASRTLASVGRNLSTLTRQSLASERALQLAASRGTLLARQNAQTSRLRGAALAGDTDAQFRYAQQLEATQNSLKRLTLQEAALGASLRQQKWERVSAGFRALSDSGRALQYTGAIGTAALGAMAVQAANFNTAVVRAATQTGHSFNDITKNATMMGPAVQDVMRHSASSSQELTDALYEINSSMTISAKGSVRLLRVLSDAAIGGMAPLENVTQGVITAMNNFNVPVSRAPQLLQRMFAGVRFGRMTFDEFSQSLATTVPAAHQQNQTFDDMVGTMAFLTRNLGNVSRASTGYARALEILNRQKTVENLKKQGVAIRDVNNRMLPLDTVLQRIIKRFPGLESGRMSWQNFLHTFAGTEGTIQARRALVELTNDMGGYSDLLGRVKGDNIEFTRSVKALSQTPGVQFKEFVNQLKVFSMQIGAGAIPAFSKMIGILQKGLDAFNGLNDATKGTIGSFLAWGAVITTLAGTVMVLVGALGRLTPLIGALGVERGLAGMMMFGRTQQRAKLAAQDVARARALTGKFMTPAEMAVVQSEFLAVNKASGGIVDAWRRAKTEFRDARRPLYDASKYTRELAVNGERYFDKATGRGVSRAIAEQGKGASALRAGLTSAGVAMGGMSVSAGVLAATLPIAAGAGYLIYRHMKASAEQAKINANAAKQLAATVQAPITAAAGLADIPTAVGNFQRARMSVQAYTAQIKALRKQLSETHDAETRASIRRDILTSVLDRAQAYAQMGVAAEAANKKLDSMNQFLDAQQVIQNKIGTKERALGTLGPLAGFGPLEARALAMKGLDLSNVKGQVDRLTESLTVLRESGRKNLEALRTNFADMVKGLQRQGALPRGIKQTMIDDLLELTKRVGTMPSLKAMKLFFKAELDPSSLRNMPQQIQRFIRSQGRRRQRVKVAADLSFDSARAEHLAQITGKSIGALKSRVNISANTDQVKQQTNAVLQWIRGRRATGKSGVKVGADTTAAKQNTQAVLSWINSLPPAHIKVTVDTAKTQADFKKDMQISSPSKLIQNILDANPNILRFKTNFHEIMEELTQVYSQVADLKKQRAEILRQGSLSADDKRQLKDIAKQIHDTIAQAYRDAVKTGTDALISKFREFRDNIDQIFGLKLDEINQIRMDWGVILNVNDLTQGLKESNAKLKDFQKDIHTLIRRGVPRSLILQLQGMGEEGQAIINAMAGATPQQRKQFVQAWHQNQRLINQAAKQQFKIQLKEWRKMGRSMALGIILGLRDEENGLYRYFRHMFIRLLREARHAVGAHSPSREFQKLGHDIVTGLEMGLTGSRVPMPNVGGVTVQPHVTMNVHAHNDESLMATMERSRFRLKNTLR